MVVTAARVLVVLVPLRSRKVVTDEEFEAICRDPRHHSGKGYQRKRKKQRAGGGGGGGGGGTLPIVHAAQ